MQPPDRLDRLFEQQQQLNRRIGVDTDAMSDAERQQWLLHQMHDLGGPAYLDARRPPRLAR